MEDDSDLEIEWVLATLCILAFLKYPPKSLKNNNQITCNY